MTQDRFGTEDVELTRALSALYAAPASASYWDGLEGRIMARVARGDVEGAWYGVLAEMVRPGLLAAAGLMLAAGLALIHSRQAEARNAYASVISPASSSVESPSRVSSVGDGDAAIHFILSH